MSDAAQMENDFNRFKKVEKNENFSIFSEFFYIFLTLFHYKVMDEKVTVYRIFIFNAQ